MYTLDGRQKKALHSALLSAFPRQAALERLVEFHLDAHLAVIAGEGPLADVAFRLMEWAEAHGRLDTLVNGARGENPHNPQLLAFERMVLEARDTRPQDAVLRQFAEQVQLAPALPADTDLEKRVFRAGFSDIAHWRARLGQAELAVCRIESPAWRALGTGFLVGPDLVMTNRHVIEPLAAQPSPPVVVRFDFKVSADGSQLRGGETFGLAPDWLAASSPVGNLDFALLRLAEPAGLRPTGGTPHAPPRGWITPQWRDLEPDETIFVIQHPQGDALKLAAGRYEGREPSRLRYRVDTEPGSSGSPCFTAQLDLIALHRGSAEGLANQGVPFDAIAPALPAGLITREAPAHATAMESTVAGTHGPHPPDVDPARAPIGSERESLTAGARRGGRAGTPLSGRAMWIVRTALLAVVLFVLWKPAAFLYEEITSAGPDTGGVRTDVAAAPHRPAVHEAELLVTWSRIDGRGTCESQPTQPRAMYRGEFSGAWPGSGAPQTRDMQLVAYGPVQVEHATASMQGGEALLVAQRQRDIARKWTFRDRVTPPVIILACVRTAGPPPEIPPFRVTTWSEVRP